MMRLILSPRARWASKRRSVGMGLVRPRAPRPLARRHVAAPWIVLGVAWTLALLTGLYAASLGEARDRARFDAAAPDSLPE